MKSTQFQETVSIERSPFIAEKTLSCPTRSKLVAIYLPISLLFTNLHAYFILYTFHAFDTPFCKINFLT